MLGGDLYNKTRRSEAERGYGSRSTKDKPEVDVELLLQGAEKLCSVYAVPGAAERIAAQRRRYAQLRDNVAYHEERVAGQRRELERMSRASVGEDDDQDMDGQDVGKEHEDQGDDVIDGDLDLERETEDIKGLENKKRGLEERVSGMEKDLGGLLR